jgi:hypothetical protein
MLSERVGVTMICVTGHEELFWNVSVLQGVGYTCPILLWMYACVFVCVCAIGCMYE